jgi:Ca2+-binding EF-hand superfamily protein
MKSTRRDKRSRLTEQKRKEIKEAFDLFDLDGSGKNLSFLLLLLFSRL